ncbi:MAG: TIGR03620 family F420-dependent LLM class oxidoreductase [Trebonia sp.]
MPKIELGPVGAVLNPDGGNAFVDTAVELEELGYSTIWLTGGPLGDLGQIADVVRATKRARVASGIISVDRFGADEVAALFTDLEATHPGRFVVGLGGAHGPNPLPTLTAYLDRLDSVPARSRVMAALGPRMLDLARDRAAGAFPVLVTPDYTARARSRLGGDTTLAIEQLVVVETDPERARAIARGPLGFLGRLPSYQASFRRMGFTDDEITQLADRLVDALVAWGDADSVAAAVSAQLRSGADHVAISVISDGPQDQSTGQWRQLAQRLIVA